MMYVLPMLLGQTYDLGKEVPGLQIFSTDVKNDAVKIEHFLTDSQYRMVENAQEMKDFLDVSGKLSLKIKGGLVDISGEGRYLKDSSSQSNGLEILVKLHFETVTFTIPSWKKPNADWSTLPSQFLGTHYCRSLTYGGDLVASIRISGSSRHDLKRIKGAVSGEIKTTGGSFEGDIKGRLDLLKQSAEGSSSMEINYYASVPLHGVSYTIDGLMNLIDQFPEHVKKVNNGLGNPLKMELYPLNSLKEGYPAYFENRALTDELDDLDNQFDDLRNTRHQLNIWITQLPPSVPDSVQKKIDNFMKKLNYIYGVFVKTISDLDVAQGASTQPVTDAFEAYKDGGYMLQQKYFRKFQSLLTDIYKEAPVLRPKIGGAHYVHWGRSDCSSSEIEISMSGVATASEIQSNGGSSDFVCSKVDVEEVKPEDYFENYKTNRKNDVSYLHLTPIWYNGIMDRYKSMRGKNLACSHCRSISRTALVTKMATSVCPDGWVKEYDGYLMAASKDAKGEFVCVDKDMREPNGQVTFGESKDGSTQELKEVTVLCGSLPCEIYVEMKPIECVVCTV